MTRNPGGFSDHMSKQFNNPEFSDVAILLDKDDAEEGHDLDTQTFYGHRVILATMSDYFRTMLFGSFVEAGKREIRLPGVPYSLFVDVMRFVYFGWTDLTAVESVDEAVEYYSLCRMLLVHSKMEMFFETWMIRKIETWEKELLRIFALAYEWDMLRLKLECSKRIKGIANECLADSLFVELPVGAVRMILDSTNINCTRAELEKAIQEWINYHEKEISADMADGLIGGLTCFGELCYTYNVLSLYPVEDIPKTEETQLLAMCLEPLEILHEYSYKSELHILKCFTLKGIKICLKANHQFGVQYGQIKSEFDLCLDIKTIKENLWGMSTLIVNCKRNLTIRYDFTEHDQQSVTIFLPDLMCCKKCQLNFNFSWTDTTVQPLLQNYGPVRGNTMVETGSSYVTHIIYQTNRNVSSGRCPECPILDRDALSIFSTSYESDDSDEEMDEEEEEETESGSSEEYED